MVWKALSDIVRLSTFAWGPQALLLKQIKAWVRSEGNVERSRAARQLLNPTCCPLVRFSHIASSHTYRSIEDTARDGPCAHGKATQRTRKAMRMLPGCATPLYVSLLSTVPSDREATICLRYPGNADVDINNLIIFTRLRSASLVSTFLSLTEHKDLRLGLSDVARPSIRFKIDLKSLEGARGVQG